MAKIPTLLASAKLDSYAAPRASASSFGADTSPLAEASMSVARSADRISDIRHQRKLELSELDQIRRLNEAESYIRKLSSDFVNDPANQASETAHDDWEAKLGEARAKLESDGGFSPKTLAKFNDMASSIGDATYGRLLGNASSLKMQRATVSVVENHSLSIQGSSVDQHIPVFEQAVSQVDSILAAHPDAASKLKADLQKEAVLGYLTRDISASVRMLDSYNYVDQATRRTLANAIENQREQGRRELRHEFQQYESNALRTMEVTDSIPTKPPEGLTEEGFVKVYGSSEGKSRFKDFSAKWDGLLRANQIWSDLVSKSPSEQLDTWEGLASPNQGATDNFLPESLSQSIMREALGKKVSESLRVIQNEGGAAWLLRYDPTLRTEWAVLNGSPGAAGPVNSLERELFNKALIEKQKNFLGIAVPSLLTKPQADQWARTLASTTNPDEVLSLIDRLTKDYPTNDQLSIAINDIKTLSPMGKDISGEFQFLIQNRNQPWISDYVLAQKNKANNLERIGGSDTNTKTELQRKVQESLNDIGFFGMYRADQESAAREAIFTYALHLHSDKSRGYGIGKAVAEATDRLIKSTLTPVTFNDSVTLIPKPVKESGDTVEVDPKRVSGVLRSALKNLDATKLHPSFYTGLPYSKPEDQARDSLSTLEANGWFELSSDGRELQLVARGLDGIPRIVIDTDGKPLALDVEELNERASSTNASSLRTVTGPGLGTFSIPNTTEFGKTKSGNWHVRSKSN